MIAQLSGILLPVLTLAGIGYAWRRLDFPFEREFVTRVIMNVSGPCLIVDSLSRLTLPIAELVNMIAACIAMFAATIMCAWVVLRLAGLSIRSYLPALAIGNHGNMGLPLCLFAFGEAGLALGVAVYVTNSVGQFTLTPILQSRASPLRTLATTPVIYGALIGSVVLAGDVQLPEWIATTIGLLGGLMIPLMLLALGNTLGGLRAKRLPMALSLGGTRLVIGFVVALGVAELFGLEGISKGVLILQGAMPAAIFNYLFAARYDRDADDVAGIVLASTFVSALTLPLLVIYALSVSA
ncbi:AEC family transporter [Candidatus Rariloculus sp.]|uniref:AEC family transporter n=1 Tax=Candidatus Rariloculus sp. TaxID=3101265 RepID=UPI003D0F8CE9